jgi:hypothetical protein
MEARFTFPPFSVLNAREGEWQARKQAWLALGIESEVGRATSRPSGHGDSRLGTTQSGYTGGDAWRSGAKRLSESTKLAGGSCGISANAYQNPGTWEVTPASASGTSIFDPVLCELIYRWFTPPTGAVLDPFAGGSVRGIVAGMLGRAYTGCELSAPQVAANEAQRASICPDARIWWHNGDSRELLPRLAAVLPEHGGKPLGGYDALFSCPPYFNLEVYSDDPRDLSAMQWPEFCEAYRTVIREACALLKPDAFACFVVGDMRDTKTGLYRNFPAITTEAFLAAGCGLYNEVVLVTAVGSLPIRAGKQFAAGRKLGNTHQRVTVYVKGDWKRAAAACGAFE